MQFKSLLIITVLCTGCSFSNSPQSNVRGQANNADILEGRLSILTGGRGAGSLTGKDGKCHDLALPASVLSNVKDWDGYTVIVHGESIARPSVDGALHYKILDRQVEAGGCGDETFYVREIEKK
ncbi:hypothetical protein [Lysobacter sp. Hz 25]|uniref:hypothetical protein n=1 Tax=Lysobacter sp. Hz 25 TaxID=3383698 RepID=UPI0038D35CB8